MAVFSQQSPPISNKEDRSEGTWIAAACGMAQYALLVASSLGVGSWALERGREWNFTRLRSAAPFGEKIRLLSLNGTIRAGESVNGRVEAVPIGPKNAIEVVIRVDERE